MIERLFKAEAAEKKMGFAHAVRLGDMLYLSGAVSWNEALEPQHTGDMAGQMGHIYGGLQTFLTSLGASMNQVVREVVYVTSIDQALAVAEVRRAYFEDEALPAATWVEVARLIHPDLLIEVEMTVFLGTC